MPPGTNIEDQRVAKIRPQPFLEFRGYGKGYTSTYDGEFEAGYKKLDDV